MRGNRSLTLQHIQHDRIPLDKEDATDVLKHLHHLWRFDVRLDSIQEDKVTTSYVCDDESVHEAEGEAAA